MYVSHQVGLHSLFARLRHLHKHFSPFFLFKHFCSSVSSNNFSYKIVNAIVNGDQQDRTCTNNCPHFSSSNSFAVLPLFKIVNVDQQDRSLAQTLSPFSLFKHFCSFASLPVLPLQAISVFPVPLFPFCSLSHPLFPWSGSLTQNYLSPHSFQSFWSKLFEASYHKKFQS